MNFLNIAFLVGMAAAALPILIHLFSKRKTRELPFSSLEYLREISLKRVRRMQLRQFLLLALRVLIVALFAAAMARPAIRGAQSPMTRGSSTVAIVIDNSFSMASLAPSRMGDLSDAIPSRADEGEALPGVPSEAGTLYEQAKDRAMEILELMREGDQGLLAFTGRPASLPFQTPVANHGLLRQEVQRTPLAATPSDLPVALEQVLAMLETARTINKELFIISDFQQSDLTRWLEAREREGGITLADFFVGEAYADTARSGSAVIPADVQVYVVPVRQETQDNLSVTHLRFEPGGGAGGTGKVTATVRNHGLSPVSDRLARVFEAGAGAGSGGVDAVADASFSVPALGETEVEIELPRLPESGAVEVVLGADPLEWDNHAFLVTADPGVRSVLLVSGSGGATTGPEVIVVETGLAKDDTRYLARALDPAGNGRFFEVSITGPDAISDPSRLDVDLVVLSDVGRLSEPAIQNLIRFRERGGGILVCMGDRIDLRYYNTEILGRIAPGIELMNVMQESGSGAYRSLRPTVVGHPVFAGFPLSPGDDLSSARFRKIVEARLKSSAEDPAASADSTTLRVLAHFGSEIPALIESDGVVVFTSSLDGEWNDFVTSASFPPVLHRVMQYLATRAKGERGPRTVGDRLELVLAADRVQSSVSLLDPADGRTPVAAVPNEGVVRLRSEPTTLPGIYSFASETGEVFGQLAVNLDGSEGNLAVSSTNERTRYFGRDAQQLAVGQTISRDLLEGRYGRELWRELLVLVLILLVVESLLGRGRFLA